MMYQKTPLFRHQLDIKNMKNKFFVTLCLLAVFLPSIVFAQGGSSQGGAGGSSQGGAGGSSQPVNVGIPNPLGEIDSLAELVFKIVEFVISFSYVIIAFFIILSGFKFVLAQGNEEKLTEAKQMLKYTIIGAFLVIGAQIIVEVLKDVLTQIASS